MPSNYPEKYGMLANIDQDAILARLASGELMHQIAAELGCAKVSLRNKLAKHPDYEQTIKAQAHALVDEQTARLMSDEDTPPDQAIIARARARCDIAYKYAAAVDPARWGPRQQLEVTVDIGQELAQIAQSMRNAATHTAIIDQSSTIEDAQVIDK